MAKRSCVSLQAERGLDGWTWVYGQAVGWMWDAECGGWTGMLDINAGRGDQDVEAAGNFQQGIPVLLQQNRLVKNVGG